MKVNTAGLFSLAHRAPTLELEVGEDVEIVADQGPPAAPRIRKTTLEHFNEEMSVLDRPLEGEVEFYDEPKPRRWRVPATGAAIFLVSCGAYLGVLRHRSTAAALAAPAPAAVVAAAPAVATPPPVAAAPSGSAAVEPASAPPAPAPAPSAAAPVVADASGAGAHHHHHARHASAGAHHHHHGGRGHHGRA